MGPANRLAKGQELAVIGFFRVNALIPVCLGLGGDCMPREKAINYRY